MKKYFDTVLNSSGNPATGVSVLVKNYPSLTTATIYSDNGVTTTSNPIATDSTGYFEFYAADGRYQLVISGSGVTTKTISDILIEDPADGPMAISCNSSSPALQITQTGSGNALVVEDAASDTTPFVIDSSGKVGIGRSPATNLDVSDASRYTFNLSNAYALQTALNPSGSSFVDDYKNASQHIWQISGSEKFRIDSSGNVLVKSAAGLGYGSGAGGTVTQATSKSTAVTLDKPTGQITMYGVNDANGQLAAGAYVYFTLNNSLLAAYDLLAINLSVALGAKYEVRCAQTFTGGATICVKNITAGTLAEALVINFAIIKGVIS